MPFTDSYIFPSNNKKTYFNCEGQFRILFYLVMAATIITNAVTLVV